MDDFIENIEEVYNYKTPPTAEQFYKDVFTGGVDSRVADALIKFAKLHVKSALEAAASNSTVEIVDHEELSEQAKQSNLLPVYGVDEESILNSYPLNNIR